MTAVSYTHLDAYKRQYPCYENQFQVDTAAAEGPASYANIADCETFGVAFDNNIEEWTPFDTEGWVRR